MDKKKYINDCWKLMVAPALKRYGFRLYEKNVLGRLTHDDVFQFLVLNKHRHTETFTVDVAIRPMYCENGNYLTLRPGNRLGKIVTNGRLDTWWNGETAESAEKNFAEVLQHIYESVLPFFNSTRTSSELVQSFKKNIFGNSKFGKKIDWGTSDNSSFDFAYIYLRAGDSKNSLKELEKCLSHFSAHGEDRYNRAIEHCVQLKKLAQSGKANIDEYLGKKISEGKVNLKLTNWLPADVYVKITELFANDVERKKAEILLGSLLTDERLNVSPIQVARSILAIAQGDLGVVQKIFDTTYYGDPRDVIMIAVAKSTDNLEYFCKPFPY
jgi:hypothetical protein